MRTRRPRHAAAFRPLWYRALITLWGAWFTLALTEPAGLLACRMHSGNGAHETAVVTAHEGSAPDQTAHAGVAHNASIHDATIHDAAPEHAYDTSAHHGASVSSALVASNAPTTNAPTHDCCTCLGQCCTAAPVATPVVQTALAPQLLVDVAAPTFAQIRMVHVQREYLLPFANGPPAPSVA